MTLLDDTGTRLGASFDFDGFVARHSPRLRRILARRTGDLHEADEVLQEALLRAYEHRSSFVDDDGAAAWTTVVAQRLAVDRHRVARRSVSVAEIPEVGSVGRDTADVVVASSEARVALDVLQGLPRRQAAILWAREIEGLSYSEIAERLDLSEPTVRTVLSRGRQALRKEFVRRGHALPVAGLVPFAPALLALRGGRELGRPVRRVLEAKVLGAAAAAVLAAGLVTAAVPWTSTVEPDTVLVPASPAGLSVDPAPAAPAAEPVAPSVGSVEAPAPAAPAARVEPAAAPPAPPSGPVVPLDRTCAGTGGLAGCLHDAPPEGGDTLVVDVPLPSNPAGIDSPGVNTDHVAACRDLPNVPLTSCTADENPDGDSR